MQKNKQGFWLPFVLQQNKTNTQPALKTMGNLSIKRELVEGINRHYTLLLIQPSSVPQLHFSIK